MQEKYNFCEMNPNSYFFYFKSKVGNIISRHAVWIDRLDWNLALKKAQEMACALDSELILNYHFTPDGQFITDN